MKSHIGWLEWQRSIFGRCSQEFNILQQKGEGIVNEGLLDPQLVSDKYGGKVGKNLIELAHKFESQHQVSTVPEHIYTCI